IAGLFNAYNRVSAKLSSADSNVPWSYNTSTWRVADNNNNNRATWLDGLQQISVTASYQDQITLTAATASGAIGILFDATSGTQRSMEPTRSPAGRPEATKGWYLSIWPRLPCWVCTSHRRWNGAARSAR